MSLSREENYCKDFTKLPRDCMVFLSFLSLTFSLVILSPCTSLYSFTLNVFELLAGSTLVILHICSQSWITYTEDPSLSPSIFIPRIPSPIIYVALYLPTKAKDSQKQATSCSAPHYILRAMKISLSWFYITNNENLFTFCFFFIVCKIFSHYTRSH